MEQFITSKKLLPFSGNCIAFRDLKYHMPDFLKDKILKSPLSWTFSLYGILSLLDVFNGRFKKTIDRYYQLHIQPEEDPHFCGNVIYTAPNESENLHESQLKYTIAAFEYVHLDVFKKIEELKRRVNLMEEYIKDENVFFVYSVNDIDCNYLTENDIKFFIEKLKEFGISEKRFIIVQTSNIEAVLGGIKTGGKEGTWENYRKIEFSKYFSNVYTYNICSGDGLLNYAQYLNRLLEE